MFLLRFQLWDINMDSGPVSTFQVHEYLRPKVCFMLVSVIYLLQNVFSYTESLCSFFQLCDLYENDSIFDKFECCLSGDGLRVATGSYRSAYMFPLMYPWYSLSWIALSDPKKEGEKEEKVPLMSFSFFLGGVFAAICFVCLVVLLEVQRPQLWRPVKIRWGILHYTTWLKTG